MIYLPQFSLELRSWRSFDRVYVVGFYGESLRKLIQFQLQIFVCGYLEEEMDNNYYQDARRPNNWQVIIDMGIQYVYIYPSLTIELLYS